MKNKYLIVLIYLFSLFFLLLNIKSVPIYSDEITWMVRGKEAVYSIIHGSFYYFKTAISECDKDFSCQFFGFPLILLNGTSQIIFAGAGRYSLNIFSDIVASRLPLVLVNSLIPVFIYLISNKLFEDKKIALFSGILFILNPALIVLGVWIINDGLLTLFIMLSIYSYMVYESKNRFNIIPALFAVLAFTSKPSGILVIITWLGFFLLSKNIKSLKFFIYNLVFFFILIQIFWPYSWYHPFLSIFEYIYRQYNFVNSNHLENYYLGITSSNPHWSYYPFLISTRLTELTVLGLIIGIINFSKRIKLMLPVILFFLVYLFVISFSSQKIDLRYALPIIPYILIVAGHGLLTIAKFVFVKFKLVSVVLIALLIYPLTWMRSGHIYFNNFIGEARGAQSRVLVGWCTSTKDALYYLNETMAEGSVYIAGCPASTPYYSGMKVNKNFHYADYIIIETYYTYQHPDSPVMKYVQNKKIIKEISEKGATLAVIYKN